jgi:hypothetical protein
LQKIFNDSGEKVPEDQSKALPQEETKHEYQAPTIESVVTPENLEREVQYAGTFTGLR